MSANGQVQTPWTPPPAPASRVLAALQRLASMQDWHRVPIALIAQDTGYSERHVKRLLRQMDIKRTSKGHAGDIEGTSKGHAGDMQGTSKGHAGDIEGTSKGHAASLFPTGNGDEICSLVLSLPYSSPVLDPKILLDPKDPKEKPPPLPPLGGLHTRTHTRVQYPPGFEAWWKTYPAARRVDKKACGRTWVRDGLESRVDEIIAHTEAMKQTRQWQDDERVPLATTYLNQERYNAPPPRPVQGNGDYTQEQIDRAFAEEEAIWRATHDAR